LVSISLEVEPPINYVEALRDYGWKVKFQHIRYFVIYTGDKPELMPMHEIRQTDSQRYIEAYGGRTVCSAKKEVNGSIVEVRTEARCNNSDKYVKRIGNHLASQRLWEFIH